MLYANWRPFRSGLNVLYCVHDSFTLQRTCDVDFTSNGCFSGFGDYYAGRNQVGSIVLVMIGLSLVAMVILVILENLDISMSRDRFGSRPRTPETVPCVDPIMEEKELTIPNRDHVEQDEEHMEAEREQGNWRKFITRWNGTCK